MGSSRLFSYGCSSLRLTLDFRAQRGGALDAGQRLGLELFQRYVGRIKGSLGSEFKWRYPAALHSGTQNTALGS